MIRYQPPSELCIVEDVHAFSYNDVHITEIPGVNFSSALFGNIRFAER